jgi:hypothetical protein
MKPLDQINAQNGSDGKPMLDTHPGRTTGLPMNVQPVRIGTDTDGTAIYRDPITGDEYSTGEVESW